MATKIPQNVSMEQARAMREAAFASLSEMELRVLGTIAKGGSVFACGKPVGDDNAVVEVCKHREVIPGGGATVRGLVRTGWLRFAPMSLPGEKSSGYFWFTSEGQRVFNLFRH